MADLNCAPEEAVAPYFSMGEVPVASPDGYTGLRFDTQPPTPFSLGSAEREGNEITRAAFLALCAKVQPARA